MYQLKLRISPAKTSQLTFDLAWHRIHKMQIVTTKLASAMRINHELVFVMSYQSRIPTKCLAQILFSMAGNIECPSQVYAIPLHVNIIGRVRVPSSNNTHQHKWRQHAIYTITSSKMQQHKCRYHKIMLHHTSINMQQQTKQNR